MLRTYNTPGIHLPSYPPVYKGSAHTVSKKEG